MILLHTGRMLGNVYPESVKGVAPLQYYPYLAAYVKQVRAEAERDGAKVVLFDSGDSLQGSFASHVTQSQNMVALFNALEYDAVILGNLDATLEPSRVSGLKAQLLSPFLDPVGQPSFPGSAPYSVLSKGDHKVALIANFYGDLAMESEPKRFPTYYQNRMNFPVKPMRDYQSIFNACEKGGATLRIFNWFKFESPDAPPAFVDRLKSWNVDAIAAHRIYSSKQKDVWGAKSYESWPVPVSENIRRENRGYTLSRLELVQKKGGKWEAVKHQLVELTRNTCPPDKEIVGVIEPFAPAIMAANAKLAELPKPFTKKEILELYLKSLAERDAGSLAFYSLDSIRSDWPVGSLTRAQVFESLPWQTPTLRVTLSPEQKSEIQTDTQYARGTEVPGNTVVTSGFFAQLLKQKFNLPETAIKVVDSKTEFELFCNWLEMNAAQLAQNP